jgi:hypothetical protein
MMAHAARDPYWQAKVRFEGEYTPAARAAIEDKCLRCHAPLDQYGYRLKETAMAMNAVTALGREGVNCTVCHQIEGRNLGSAASFTGGFEIGPGKEIFGPHANPFSMPMIHHSGYTPVESRHVLESALCGTCHTVITPTLDANGKVLGEFVEQGAYLEWLLSGYPALGTTCQTCHMPGTFDGGGKAVAQYIAHNPGMRIFPPTSPRTPFGQHFLVGGNRQMLLKFAPEGEQEKEDLAASAERTALNLARAASLEVQTERVGGLLRVSVTVWNRTGHKLPTGFPSRRMWVHLTIKDARGSTVFESGGWDETTTEIRGYSGPQPHHQVITHAPQAMIYEAQYADSEGKPTISLLRAARYVKDNRILPMGHDGGRPLPQGVRVEQVASQGVAADGNFRGGADTVVYEISWKGEEELRVEAELLYQAIRPEHLAGVENAKDLLTRPERIAAVRVSP